VVGVVAEDDLTQAIKKNRREGEEGAHLTDMLRSVLTRTGLAQNHTAVSWVQWK